jgi:AraC-like DNA-binding protein
MSLYTTPLQFAYFFGLLFAILFWVRAYREERTSDALLGFVMFFLAMEIQDYTFGFAGINYLWEDMNGFPRYFSLAFAPTIYFYLKSQINKDFRLEKKHLLHYVPYLVYFIINLIVFLQGKAFVDDWNKSSAVSILSKVEMVAVYGSYIYYFYKSLQLYKEYRTWTTNEFSDTDSVSFVWLRNFIYLIIAGEVFKFSWSMIDKVMDLPFEQDWWWHLLTVCIIVYVGLQGYTQKQLKKLLFQAESDNEKTETIVDQSLTTSTELVSKESEQVDVNSITDEATPIPDIITDNLITKSEPTIDFSNLIPKIEKAFNEDKIFLESELSLSELAQKLKTNSSILSAAINQTYKKNFNDFVNEYRIREYETQIANPKNRNFTKLAIALDCGFNSRATFHRAMKKFGSEGQNNVQFL